MELEQEKPSLSPLKKESERPNSSTQLNTEYSDTATGTSQGSFSKRLRNDISRLWQEYTSFDHPIYRTPAALWMRSKMRSSKFVGKMTVCSWTFSLGVLM